MSTSAYKLIIEDDEGRRSVVPVDLDPSQDVSVGRDQANTICLNERNVSRRHARFFEDPTGIFAEDLSSYNGVWINGDRIEKREPVFRATFYAWGILISSCAVKGFTLGAMKRPSVPLDRWPSRLSLALR